MANEARVGVSLQINQVSTGKNYQSRPTSFNANVTGVNGPTPGTVVCAVNHTEPSLTQITAKGGFCRIQNLDPTNFVTVGIYSSHFVEFFPFMDLYPGEFYVFRLSQFVGIDLNPGTGSGAEDAFVNALSIKANVAPCRVLVEVFDK